jgi:hypothetical protein
LATGQKIDTISKENKDAKTQADAPAVQQKNVNTTNVSSSNQQTQNTEQNIEQNTEQIKITDDNLITLLMNQCKELRNENKELIDIIKNGTHNTNNSHNTINSNNKTFNLQFFLNETCKDAMNIMDFVDSIKLQLSDLEKVGEI